MSTSTVTIQDPLDRRLLAWAGERWPPASAISVVLIYVSAVLFEHALAGSGTLTLSASDFVVLPGALAYSLLIRVLDEHKDYDLDLANHPGRVLQSGRVELRHLRPIGAVCFALMLIVSLIADGGLGPVTTWWAIVMGWTVLMTKEFFAHDLHRRWRLVLVATHGVALPLTVCWIGAAAADGEPLPAALGWFALFLFLTSIVADVGRKLEAPEDERPLLDSYTRTLGTTGAPLLLAAAAVLAVPAGCLLLAAADAGSAVAYTALALTIVPALAGAARFARRPTRERSERAEALARLSVLLALLAPVIALIVVRGMGWS
jgi:4-hydroxybenzoate polyprenyltransferase